MGVRSSCRKPSSPRPPGAMIRSGQRMGRSFLIGSGVLPAERCTSCAESIRTG